MSRKGPAKIRKVEPEAVYNSVTVAKIINGSMYAGLKNAASKQVYDALDLIKKEMPKV